MIIPMPFITSAVAGSTKCPRMKSRTDSWIAFSADIGPREGPDECTTAGAGVR